ncbi:dihydroneopterin triphosphate diphosphatase [Xenophilus arseniciresistens]|uniref:Dihydroneopterin triphosphate diphosphatase n=1 Tax=Xenophilus arseniciresistens TaxID=1283306 RepID=A0AAE3SZM9_9BURK|nr:dihydroneopterin triphosphate diphosphatase [Xenophilus arseniciresistens]MDA7416690.1 dihydroneopterin triphosphate diphosphatase [Xenophilus arseniciresistens]
MPHKIPESVLVVIHTPALEVLLIRRADTEAEFWQSVTGSKDSPDEPFAETARREVEEETGWRCGVEGRLTDWGLENVYEIYPRWRARYAPGVTHNTEHLFSLCLPAALTPRLAPREHTHWRWLPWREAAAACFSPSNAEAILLLPQFAR